jgi:hypothetical protein
MTRSTSSDPGANASPGTLPSAPLLTVALALAALVTGTASEAEPPETAVVSVTLAGGEVGAPVETVTVARRGDMRTLTLSHKGFDKPLRTETVSLSADDFAGVWAVVTAQKLLEFTPKEEPGDVFDYGTDTLRTETREKPGDKPRVREQSWSRPLVNQDRISPLLVALARLARDRGKTVKLENFVP